MDLTTGFPADFIWGTATAAHQVEGGNWNSDWWAWEHDPDAPTTEPSGDACDHYHRYADDMALLGQLGFDAYRFSLEWSRIEPEDGEFSAAQIAHYRRMCLAARAAGLRPIVTLHHFTTPRWLAGEGGFVWRETPARFARYAATVAEALGDVVDAVCTINEPNMVALHGYLTGVFPPGGRDPGARMTANEILIACHRSAVDAVRTAAPGVPVGLTVAMPEWVAVDGGEEMLETLRRPMEDVFLAATAGDDFIGVQTYTRDLIGPDGHRPAPPGSRTTLMGYEFHPEALEATIRRAAHVTGLPIIVTENGVATDDDTERVEYIDRALHGVRRCLADGIRVGGYVHWSALDNFEWTLGYGPAFGLIAVDRITQERTVKPSAHHLGGIARANRS
jgi:beta-glucosidase